MEKLFLLIVILLNAGVAWWNCQALGGVWKDIRIFGNSFSNFVLFAGAFQSIAGFSIAVVPLITKIMTSYDRAREILSPFWYVGLIIPLFGIGFILWAHSMTAAYQDRNWDHITKRGYGRLMRIENEGSMFAVAFTAFYNVREEEVNYNVERTLTVEILMIMGAVIFSPLLITIYLIRRYARKAPSRAVTLLKEQKLLRSKASR